jgi:hypothetical protein
MPGRLEDLTGWVEYDENGHLPEGDSLRCVARARISDGIKYPRFEDDTYPHPYKPAWNPEVRRNVHVTQKQLDEGTMRPVRNSSDPEAKRECRHHGEVDDDHFPCRGP